MGPGGYLRDFLDLGKVRISVLVTITATAGHVMARGEVSRLLLIPALGTFFLSAGASTLNHYQERHIDSMMERTKNRPLPSGRITPHVALAFAAFCIFNGSFILLLGGGVVSMLLGLLALAWYNGVYTPLKRVSAFAVLPGSVIGALPPMIGWTAAGGSVFDQRILAVAFFLFVWQIPHFWLLLAKYGPQYEAAGFPSLTQVFTHQQLTRLTLWWIWATICACMAMPLFGMGSTIVVVIALGLANLALAGSSVQLLRDPEDRSIWGRTFLKINLYVFFVMLLLAGERVFLAG